MGMRRHVASEVRGLGGAAGMGDPRGAGGWQARLARWGGLPVGAGGAGTWGTLFDCDVLTDYGKSTPTRKCPDNVVSMDYVV